MSEELTQLAVLKELILLDSAGPDMQPDALLLFSRDLAPTVERILDASRTSRERQIRPRRCDLWPPNTWRVIPELPRALEADIIEDF